MGTGRRSLAFTSIVLLIGVAVFSMPAALADSRSAGGALPDCSSPFDPYSYPVSFLQECGDAIHPLTNSSPMPGGGTESDYQVDGHLVRAYAPPDNFNFLTATPEQLDEYGLPPKPDGGAQLDNWTHYMSIARSVADPPFLVGVPQSSASTETSTNWSGYAVVGNLERFTQAQGQWIEPSFGSSACNSPEEVTWAGIGGFAGQPLGQNGTAWNEGGVANHEAWWQITSESPYVQPYSQVYGHPGYGFVASTRWLGDAYRFFWEDEKTGTEKAMDVSAADRTDYTGDSAEIIAERPTIYQPYTHHSYLANFGSLNIQSAEINGFGMEKFDPNGTREGLNMTNDDGTHTLATAGVVSTDGAFTDHQLRCS